MSRRLAPNIEASIARAAERAGVDPGMLRTFVLIESGGRPDVTTGSYRGLLQLSPSEFRRYGGEGDIYDPDRNLMAGALKLKMESAGFKEKYGRDPTPTELYMIHQQGVGGSAAHMANPDKPAWENMFSTAEGRARGPEWSKKAIWGNVPDDVKARYGSVENMTSADFMKLWDDKVTRIAGTPSASPTMAVGASPTPGAPLATAMADLAAGDDAGAAWKAPVAAPMPSVALASAGPDADMTMAGTGDAAPESGFATTAIPEDQKTGLAAFMDSLGEGAKDPNQQFVENFMKEAQEKQDEANMAAAQSDTLKTPLKQADLRSVLKLLQAKRAAGTLGTMGS